ncbi:hypothetical protein STRNTR1_0049 [Stenotrophomonas maltophilia]|nr:hypothetical protein STRNTR1_0049 [Stenotrophomonas maltophilia]
MGRQTPEFTQSLLRSCRPLAGTPGQSATLGRARRPAAGTTL